MSDLGGSAGMAALTRLYGFVGDAALFAVQHIGTLQNSDNELARHCGDVLAAANEGFGLGAETALLVIGIGQSMLGNPLAGSIALNATANPIVMTCAAIGAIHYGWKAMSAGERETLLRSVSSAFNIGVELIRSIVSFAVGTIKALLISDNMTELKKMITEVAATFGKRLSEVTRALGDRAAELSSYAGAAVASAALAARSRLPTRARGPGPPTP